MAWSPATSSATVAFNTNPYGPEVWVSPNEDGWEARHVGNGWVGQVSPDGKLVAFRLAHTEGLLPKTDIARAPVTGGPVTLLTHDGVSGWPL